MKKKNIALLFWVIVLITAVGIGSMYMERMKLNWNKKVNLEEYEMSISYPIAYEDIDKNTSKVRNISQSLKITETDTPISNGMSKFLPRLVENLIEAQNSRTGLALLVEGIKVDKTSKNLEDICKDYITMFKVYNSEETVVESNYKLITIDGHEAGKVNVYVRGKTNKIFPGIEAYLLSLDDREITIVFSGHKKMIEENRKEIDKIISSIKIK